MIPEIATFLMVLATIFAGAQSLCLCKGTLQNTLQPMIYRLGTLVFLLIFAAFLMLVGLRIASDFSVANVAEHSNKALPLLFKIAGTWGNHEGSMLLWALVTAGFGAILGLSRARHTPLIHASVAVQSAITLGVMLFIIFTSNPFARVFPPEYDGAMLNPLLQDFALAIHPPLLYVGYVGFSLVYSLAVGGLLTHSINHAWAAIIHPWVMTAWAFLTAGIALGSWWAYRELGWGGYWFWDPVENASLLPWLSGTALLHANLVLKKRNQLASWVVLLAVFTFGLSLIGTFLVRSGVITSVHSFASDPTRGTYILCYIVLTIGSALWLYGARAKHVNPQAAMLRPSSREGMIVVNNIFIITATVTVLLGTLYPLFTDWFQNRSITVGAPYFNLVFLPIMAVPLFFAGLVPFIPWKKAAFFPSVQKAWPAFAVALIVALLIWAVVSTHTLLAALGFGLASFLLAASSQWMLGDKWRNARHWPVFLGHSGAALLIIGITGTGLWQQTIEQPIRVGERVTIAGYQLTYVAEAPLITANYTADMASIRVEKEGALIATLSPEFRHYPMRNTTTSEASIHSTAAYDLYSVIGEKDAATGERALRIYYKPTIGFLWVGALFITIAGLFAAWLARKKA